MLELKEKKILIAGLGLSGKAVLEVLSATEANIAVCDTRDIEWDDSRLYKKIHITGIPAFLNGMEVPDEKWDYVILSPGIPLDTYFVENARKQGSVIMGELEFAFEMSDGRFVAITGTNGKTTTTTLVGEMFKNSGKKTIVGGNIGIPIISELSDIDNDTEVIAEVSSFQLESIINFRPAVSALLNLTPDHMDRHKTMDAYGAVKSDIFKNQTADDYLVFNYDDERVNELVSHANAIKIPFSRLEKLERGTYVDNDKLIIRDNNIEIQIIHKDELLIQGNHNLENALASSAIAYFGGVDIPTIAQTLKTFSGVSHRLELIGIRRGIKFINDSKGTNPDASMKAIDAVGENIFLIAGGYNKNSDFSEFISSFKGRVKHLLLIGETKEIIKETAEKMDIDNITVCDNMAQAVRIGYEYADEGDTVLLSPASASWDMYENFEERGDHFRKVVEELE